MNALSPGGLTPETGPDRAGARARSARRGAKSSPAGGGDQVRLMADLEDEAEAPIGGVMLEEIGDEDGGDEDGGGEDGGAGNSRDRDGGDGASLAAGGDFEAGREVGTNTQASGTNGPGDQTVAELGVAERGLDARTSDLTADRVADRTSDRTAGRALPVGGAGNRASRPDAGHEASAEMLADGGTYGVSDATPERAPAERFAHKPGSGSMDEAGDEAGAQGAEEGGEDRGISAPYGRSGDSGRGEPFATGPSRAPFDAHGERAESAMVSPAMSPAMSPTVSPVAHVSPALSARQAAAPFGGTPPSLGQAASADSWDRAPQALRARASGQDGGRALASFGMPSQLTGIEVTLSVQIGTHQLSLRDLLTVEPGLLVPLDRMTSEPVDILVNGRLFARGEVVAIGDRFGVRLLSLVEAPDAR